MKILLIVLFSLFALQEPVQQETKKVEATPVKQEAKAETPAVVTEKSTVKIITENEISVKARKGETVVFTQEQIKKMMESSQTSNDTTGIVFENGAFYTKIGNMSIPLSGGGASGCFGNSTVKIPEALKNVEIKTKDEKENPDKPKEQ